MTESPPTDHRLQVVVSVPTFKRTDLLEQLLPHLTRQADSLAHDTRIIVVDNDPAESARKLVAGWSDRGVEYVAEHRPGIAAARNRALDEAADADLLVFLDDDEEPGEQWLSRLVTAWQGWQCAAVAGPVTSLFEGPVDDWVAACATFRRPRRPTGTLMEGSATNNLLLDLDQVRRLDLRFDDRFGLTGGSDTLLTRTLVKRGGEIRWCDEAEMFETVPPERATRDWALRRSLRTGNVWSRVAITLADSAPQRGKRRAVQTLRPLLRILRGLVWAVTGTVTRNLQLRVDGELDVATGIGALRGAYGHLVVEYKRPVTSD